MAKRVAVIDIGSNSIRMVVYEKTSRFAFHLLHEAKSKVRISENAYQNSGNLQEIPMQRTYFALQDFLSIASSFKATKILCVATSALRDAPNRKEFISRIKNELHLNIKVIEGQKEAYLGAIACANLLPEQTNALSVDIGGGSTEFAYINKKDVSNTVSLKLGTVRLKELYFDTNKVDEAVMYIDAELNVLNDLNPSSIIGIGGTFRALASAIMLDTKYPLDKLHAYEFDINKFKSHIEAILDANESKLKKLGIKPERYDVIKPGALILSRILKKLTVSNLITSGVGVREGAYLADLLRNSKDKLPNNYNTSVRYLLDSHTQDTNFSNQLSQLSKNIFDLSYEHLKIDKKYRSDLAIAAKLYPIGSSVHFYSKNKHSYYLIQTALEYGFTHKQIILIATLARYAKSRLPSIAHRHKYKQLLPDTNTLNALSYIISLALALLSHKPRNIDFEITFEKSTLRIKSQNSLYLSKDAVARLEGIKQLKVNFLP